MIRNLFVLMFVAACGGQYAATPPSSLPTPPAGAQLYANMQNASGWVATTTGAGGGAGTAVLTQSIASPSLSGSSMSVSCTSTASTSPANCLFYQKTLGCPTAVPGGCVATADIHILEDFYIYVPAGSVFQAIENDPDLYDGAYEYFNSRQCDSATGDWRLWNMASTNWITTAYPCPLLSSLGTWHHEREYTVISRGVSQSYYQGFEFDGQNVWSGLNQAFPPKALAGTAALNFEVQGDLNASSGTTAQVFYIDKMNAWVW